MVEEVVEVFSQNAEAYDSWYRTPAGSAVLEAEASLLDLLLPRGVGADIGAGTGVFAEKLSENREIVCLDPSEPMLRLARGRCQHLVVGVGEQPPLRSGSLSFAYMVTVLEFLENPRKVLESVRGLLREGGVLAVLSIERESPWGQLYRRLASENLDPVLAKAKFYSRREAEDFLLEAGYSISTRAWALDYEPLAVPEGKPRLYVDEECLRCGVYALVAKPLHFQ
ncbi:class I SAM-dependent methyltransferase [Infirmifilum sp. SLHALR2]